MFEDIKQTKLSQARLDQLFKKHRDSLSGLFEEGIHPSQINVTENGFEVEKTENPQVISREELRSKYEEAKEFLNDRFSGRSVNYMLKHPDTDSKDLDYLADVTVYHLAKEKKGVFKISEKNIPDLWNKVREVYDRQYEFRNNEKPARATIEYTEKQLVKNRKMNVTGLTTRAYSLVLGLKQYRTMILKKKIAIGFDQVEGRLEHLEEKYKQPSKKKPLKLGRQNSLEACSLWVSTHYWRATAFNGSKKAFPFP